MSTLESRLDKLVGSAFPAQLPTWFSRLVGSWAWWITIPVIIVQPWITWGYWDKVHASHTGAPNFFFYLSIAITCAEVAMQLRAIPDLRLFKRRGWHLLYYSAFFNVAYGVVRIFSTNGSIGPLFGMMVISAIFFYLLFQVRPSFIVAKR